MNYNIIRKLRMTSVGEYFPGSPEHSLVQAANSGDLETLQKSLLEVKNINGEAILVQRYGWSASSLWWAAYHGHIHIIEELMKYSKIDVNKKRQYNGTTPLMISCYQGKIEAAMLLLRKGANVLIEDENGYTALTCALRSNITVLREGKQRYLLSMALLQRYPRNKLEKALEEVQDRCPGLINTQDISILKGAPPLQELCKDIILQQTMDIDLLNLPHRIRTFLWN